MKQTFADELRNALITAGPEPLFLNEIHRLMDVVSTSEKRKVMASLREFKKTGEIEKLTNPRSNKSTYRYVGKTGTAPSIKDKMWVILRARKIVSVDDLQELTGAGREYAQEWLRALKRQGVVMSDARGIYRMVKDPVIQPEDTSKTERMRQFRERKKALYDKIDTAMGALLDVRLELSSITEKEVA